MLNSCSVSKQQRGDSAFIDGIRAECGLNWPKNYDVKNTPLARARHLGIKLGEKLKQKGCGDFDAELYIKCEGRNRTSTFKDRAALLHCQNAVELKYDHIVIASCGNAAEAQALEAKRMHLRCTIFLCPHETDPNVITRLKACGATVVPVEGGYDAAVNESHKFAKRNNLYDANSSGPYGCLEHVAYAAIGREIVEQLCRSKGQLQIAIEAVGVPFGNGSLVLGVSLGLLEKFREGALSKLPRIVAGSPADCNSAVCWFQHGLKNIKTLSTHFRVGPAVAPLSTAAPCDGIEAISEIHRSFGAVRNVSEKQLLRLAALVREDVVEVLGHFIPAEEGRKAGRPRISLDPLPAGVAGLSALVDAYAQKPERYARKGIYVAVMSGERD
jgi:threonine synthase